LRLASTLFGWMFAALGAPLGGVGSAAIAGSSGLVVGAISQVPLRKRSGELSIPTATLPAQAVCSSPSSAFCCSPLL
jgi:hypothetical protein